MAASERESVDGGAGAVARGARTGGFVVTGPVVEEARPSPQENLAAARLAYELTGHAHVNPHAGAACDRAGCMWCVGGLEVCSRCGSFEGNTTTGCPGVDFDRVLFAHDRARLPGGGAHGPEHGPVYRGELDFRGGRWVRAGSPWTPYRGWDLATGEYVAARS